MKAESAWRQHVGWHDVYVSKHAERERRHGETNRGDTNRPLGCPRPGVPTLLCAKVGVLDLRRPNRIRAAKPFEKITYAIRRGVEGADSHLARQ